VQPGLERIEDRLGLGLPDLDAVIRWRSAGFVSDAAELRDAPSMSGNTTNRLAGDMRNQPRS
jgi:hypothetical protein